MIYVNFFVPTSLLKRVYSKETHYSLYYKGSKTLKIHVLILFVALKIYLVCYVMTCT